MMDLAARSLLQAPVAAAAVVQGGRKPTHPPVIPALLGESQSLTGLATVSLAAGAVVSLYRTGVHLIPP